MYSVRIEIAKLILVGTRITYQATGVRNRKGSPNLSKKFPLRQAKITY